MPIGAFGAGMAEGAGAADDADVAGADDDPQAPLLPAASPATTHGVVSELICTLLPGG
jgi:hypothetical protein